MSALEKAREAVDDAEADLDAAIANIARNSADYWRALDYAVKAGAALDKARLNLSKAYQLYAH